MKEIPSNIMAARLSGAVDAQALVYITAKNRDTGAPESSGLWTGADHRNFTIPIPGGSQSRTYYGAGNVLRVPDINSRVGIDVGRFQIVLTALTDEVRQLVRTYNPRLAPIEVHRAEFDTKTGALLPPPQRVFKGWIDEVDWADGGDGNDYTVTLNCVSTVRALTRKLSTMYSDASQKLRDPDDNFAQYTSVSGTIDVYWGEQRAAPAATVRTVTTKVMKGG